MLYYLKSYVIKKKEITFLCSVRDKICNRIESNVITK